MIWYASPDPHCASGMRPHPHALADVAFSSEKGPLLRGLLWQGSQAPARPGSRTAGPQRRAQARTDIDHQALTGL
jgi:hypothetical protein